MLTSITPLGERGRGRRWGSTTAWYVIGSTVGGALLGAVSGALALAFGQLSPALRVVALVGAAGCLVAASTDAFGVRLPSWKRQVDENWLRRYRGWVVGGGFGVQLGSGLATIVSSAAVYAMLLLGVLTGSFWGAFAVGVTFGVCRSLPLLAVRQVRTQEALAGLHRQMAALAAAARRATVAVLGASAVALVVVAMVGGAS